MAEAKRLICKTADLPEAGMGVRFEVERDGRAEPAFAIRWQGVARAYLNRCGHVPVELDYQPGQFFDFSNLYLVCATHGALYDPASGVCMGGRCNGVGLIPLRVYEEAGHVYWLQD
jgi:nitrite reductase/ring-hydroxylating ferredoxin subunit